MYCGIDVAKAKSNICLLDKNKKVTKEFEIQHNKEGFNELDKHLTKEYLIGMETTGNYCKALYTYLKERYNVHYVDNVQMNNFAKLQYTYLKNDRVDAKLIALYMSYNFKVMDIIKETELKDLSRLYEKTIKEMVRYKFMFYSQLSIIFPELAETVDLKTSKTVPSLLARYPTPHIIKNLTYKEMEKAMREHLSKHGSLAYKEKNLKKIREAAKKSIGIKNYPTTYFTHTTKTLIFFQTQIKNLKKDLEIILKKTPYYKITEIFGYNLIGLSIIVGEIGDVRRFSNHKKFTNYCGFDISEKQSGKSESMNCFLKKTGDKKLRTIFYHLVLVHLRYKTPMATFYQRLKEKGKHPKQCMIATARKIAVKTYYHMLRCHEQE